MKISVGDSISWESAAGTLSGTVKNVYLGLAGDNKMHPWMTVEHYLCPEFKSTSTFEAGDDNLAMMRVKKVDE